MLILIHLNPPSFWFIGVFSRVIRIDDRHPITILEGKIKLNDVFVNICSIDVIAQKEHLVVELFDLSDPLVYVRKLEKRCSCAERVVIGIEISKLLSCFNQSVLPCKEEHVLAFPSN